MTDSASLEGFQPHDVAHLTPEERAARGKAARERVPRSAHAKWEPAPDRADPVALLASDDENRTAGLLPIRYGRMIASPFSFYRGSAILMASDLAGSPVSGIRAQLCGDAHLSNFGIFSSPERSQFFDINDFDETAVGPWEWDVKRLAASFEIALRDRNAEPALRRDVVMAAVRGYREAMAEFAAMRNADVWYAKFAAESMLDLVTQAGGSGAKRLKAGLEKARGKDSLRALSKLTCTVDGEVRIASRPPLLVPAEELLPPAEAERFPSVIEAFLKNYRASLSDERRTLIDGYRYVQIARKVVGVGSVGTRSWVVLMLGRDNADPLFLQMKEAGESVLEPYVGRSKYRHHGRRVVEGQRLMQAASDVALGWFRTCGFDGNEHDYYVRQLWDGKASVDTAVMPMRYWDLYAGVCGWTLARAHARSGDRIAIAAYLGGGERFDRALADFSATYADQNEQDYRALLAAVDGGRIAVETGI